MEPSVVFDSLRQTDTNLLRHKKLEMLVSHWVSVLSLLPPAPACLRALLGTFTSSSTHFLTDTQRGGLKEGDPGIPEGDGAS